MSQKKIKVCPECGSTEIKVGSGNNFSYSFCTSCSYGDIFKQPTGKVSVFYEVNPSEVKSLQKKIKDSHKL